MQLRFEIPHDIRHGTYEVKISVNDKPVDGAEVAMNVSAGSFFVNQPLERTGRRQQPSDGTESRSLEERRLASSVCDHRESARFDWFASMLAHPFVAGKYDSRRVRVRVFQHEDNGRDAFEHWCEGNQRVIELHLSDCVQRPLQFEIQSPSSHNFKLKFFETHTNRPPSELDSASTEFLQDKPSRHFGLVHFRRAQDEERRGLPISYRYYCALTEWNQAAFA